PQPSPVEPHERLSCLQVRGVQLGAPHTPGVPPPPQVCPVGQGPQASRLPQPSPAGPHLIPWPAQVSGVQRFASACPQTPFTPPPPQVCGATQSPQSWVP